MLHVFIVCVPALLPLSCAFRSFTHIPKPSESVRWGTTQAKFRHTPWRTTNTLVGQAARQLDANVAFAAAFRFHETVAMVALVTMECYIREAEERLFAEALQQRLLLGEKLYREEEEWLCTELRRQRWLREMKLRQEQSPRER